MFVGFNTFVESDIVGTGAATIRDTEMVWGLFTASAEVIVTVAV